MILNVYRRKYRRQQKARQEDYVKTICNGSFKWKCLCMNEKKNKNKFYWTTIYISMNTHGMHVCVCVYRKFSLNLSIDSSPSVIQENKSEHYRVCVTDIPFEWIGRQTCSLGVQLWYRLHLISTFLLFFFLFNLIPGKCHQPFWIWSRIFFLYFSLSFHILQRICKSIKIRDTVRIVNKFYETFHIKCVRTLFLSACTMELQTGIEKRMHNTLHSFSNISLDFCKALP